ncbi:MAG: SUMF1/EgtB/PvdO family nonheme iron enzyme [Pseudomonadota bacterium]
MKFRLSVWGVCINALVTVAVLGYSLSAFAQQAWNSDFYNPNPEEALDRILPMPCGGHMVFREVLVAAGAGAFDDLELTLGSTDKDDGYSEALREAHLAGVFPVADAVGRAYLIGRYEVTQAQHNTLSGDCTAVKDALPATGLTKVDAQVFALAYSRWLSEHHAQALLQLDGVPGHLRLPTEAEWEFAARGGLKAGAKLRDERFPMPEGGIDEYVWYKEPQRSRGEVQEIGLLSGNPLGLHDILGNVAEYVLEPFRLNKHGRLHGQAGGWMVKGGDVKTPKGSIRSSWRKEIGPLQSADALKSVGFRLVLSAPIERAAVRVGKLREEWTQLPKIDNAVVQEKKVGEQARTDPVQELSELADAADDGPFKQRMLRLRAKLQANVRSRNEARDRAALSHYRLGALLGERVRNDYCRLFDIQEIEKERLSELKQIEETRRRSPGQIAQDEVDGYRNDYERMTKLAKRQLDVAQGNLRVYQETAIELAEAFPEAVIVKQSPIAQRRLSEREWGSVVPFVAVLHRHAMAYEIGDEIPTLEQVAEDLVAIKPRGRPCDPPK